MNLSPTQVHLYFFSLEWADADLASAWKLLSATEQTRADQFHFQHHRAHFIAAHAKLRRVLAAYENTSPEALIFDLGTQGKPRLHASEFTFNLAHSHHAGLIAVGKHYALGVDLEKYQDKAKLDVAERFFSPDEVRYLHTLTESEQKKTFYQLWAKKEAVVKAIGTGIQESLASFTVPFTHETGKVVIENHPWAVHTLALSPDFAAALATHPQINEINVQK